MSEKTTPIQMLMDKSYWFVGSKPIAKVLGIESAIVLGELCSVSNYFGNKEFFFPVEKIVKNTCLTRYSVLQGLKKLKDIGILQINKKGIPAKNYYKICDEKLNQVLNEGLEIINSEKESLSVDEELKDNQSEMEHQDSSNSDQSCPSTDCKLSEFEPTSVPNSTPLLEKEVEEELGEGIPRSTTARTTEKPTAKNQAGEGSKSHPDLQETGKLMLKLIKQHNESVGNAQKLAVSTSEVSFMMKEMRDISHLVINEGADPDTLVEALKNYLLTAKDKSTWKTNWSWDDFTRHYLEFCPEFFSKDKYKNKPKGFAPAVAQNSSLEGMEILF